MPSSAIQFNSILYFQFTQGNTIFFYRFSSYPCRSIFCKKNKIVFFIWLFMIAFSVMSQLAFFFLFNFGFFFSFFEKLMRWTFEVFLSKSSFDSRAGQFEVIFFWKSHLTQEMDILRFFLSKSSSSSKDGHFEGFFIGKFIYFKSWTFGVLKCG